MTALVLNHGDEPGLPGLIDRAATMLAGARTAAEVLEAREIAGLAYDTAKRAARLCRAKAAHDDLIAAAHRAQAHALEIESKAKHLLADEYDAAQQRGEIQRHGGDRSSKVSGENLAPTVSGLGLTRKEIHEARLLRDAEAADPGLIRRALDQRLERGEEPTRAALRKMVVDAAMRGLRPQRRKSRRGPNPLHEPNPAFDAVAAIDSCCERISEQFDLHGVDFILSGYVDRPMLTRSIAKMNRGRDVLTTLLEAANAR
ncbi:MAG: hypothetical protein JJT81_20070 [Rubellimicrobium sp.]|nr:hypothetical protein [Rubellimicrobium sp.]